jgi:hypothetical protein
MFSTSRLLNDDIRPIGAAPGTRPLEDVVMEIFKKIRGTRVDVRLPAQKPIRFPGSMERLRPWAAEVMDKFDRPDRAHLVFAVRDLLRAPGRRIYPLVESPRAVAVVGAFRDETQHQKAREDPFVLVARFIVGEPWTFEMSFFEPEEVELLFRSLYIETLRRYRTVLPGPRKAETIVWLGGSLLDTPELPATWLDEIAAAMAERGFSTMPELTQQPYRRFVAVCERIGVADPRATIVWTPWAGSAAQWSGIIGSSGKPIPVIETHADSLTGALDEVLPQIDLLDPSPESDEDATGEDPPTSGDVRYYKKHFSAGGRDIMLHSKDCRHNNWRRASKAPKAIKGIEALEQGASIRQIQKCPSCEGGGHWRATF